MFKEKLNANSRAVLEVVREANSHPSALEVYEAVRGRRPKIGVASVYRILHGLTEQGYINELGRSDESCRYDAQIARHDHAVCTGCGALLDVPMEITLPAGVLEAAAQAVGIKLGSHEVRIYGKCSSCQAQEA